MNRRTKSILVVASVSLTIASMFSCSEDPIDKDNGIGDAQTILLYMTSSFTKGELRWMNANSTSLANDAIEFSADSKVFAHNGKIFVVDRATDKLHCIAPERLLGDESAATEQNLKAGANPYDMAFIGDKGYIALYGLDYVQEFNAATCALGREMPLTITGANAASIKASGNTLLVIAQRLNPSWVAEKPGLVIRINASTGTKIDEIELNLWNPHSGILSDGKLYISSQGIYDDIEWGYPASDKNGIEVVNLATKVSSVLKNGESLGGSVSYIALDEANQILYATVHDYEEYIEPVIPIDLATETIGTALAGIKHSDKWGNGSLFFDNKSKRLFVGDFSENLKIYNPATGQMTAVSDSKAAALPPYMTMAIVAR